MRPPALFVALLLFPLLASTGCKKKADHYLFQGETYKYPDATFTIGTKTAEKGMIKFEPGTLGEHETATLTYTTPCGKATVTASPKYPPNSSGAIVIDFPPPSESVELYFDPSLEGHEIESPRLKIPAPDPLKGGLRVVFADCPRTLKIDGRTVKVPELGKAGYVLVAASPQSCYISGVALYGPKSGDCVSESSEKLTGQDAYAIPRRPDYLFRPITASVHATGSCVNVPYVQTCK